MFTAVRANQATSECVKVFKPLHVFHTLCVVDNFKHTRVQCLPITTDKSKPFFANVLKTKVFIAMQSVQKVKGSQFSVHAKMFYFFVCTHIHWWGVLLTLTGIPCPSASHRPLLLCTHCMWHVFHLKNQANCLCIVMCVWERDRKHLENGYRLLLTQFWSNSPWLSVA